MFIESCYTVGVVDKLSDYLEKAYLNWQMQHGRASITRFAEFLGMKRSYLTLLMNGDRTSISMELALQIADHLGDDTILTILGYSIPGSLTLDHLPEKQKVIIKRIISRIESELDRLGIDADSDEGEAVADRIFEEFGLTKIETKVFPEP